MQICGVIAEYNPFHQGHAYHLKKARELAGCDYIIVAMSGSFVQRGEPALLDKWVRTACALQNGADLVVELPSRFAVRSADMFASGGVRLLSGLGANSLCFGSELPLHTLTAAASVLEMEDKALSAAIRQGLDRGETLARARGKALEAALGIANEHLNAPNTALAIEYIRANMRLTSPMALYAVERLGGYHDESLPEENNTFASASAIRSALRGGCVEGLSDHLPTATAEALQDARRFADMTRFDDLLLSCLRNQTAEDLECLCDAGEGVERRIWKAARQAVAREELLDLAKCKRYTRARLSRLCAQAMLGLEKQVDEKPAYARLLGFRRDAAPLMRYINGRAEMPLCADAAALKDIPDFRMDARATDIRGLCTRDPQMRQADADYRHPPVIL